MKLKTGILAANKKMICGHPIRGCGPHMSKDICGVRLGADIEYALTSVLPISISSLSLSLHALEA